MSSILAGVIVLTAVWSGSGPEGGFVVKAAFNEANKGCVNTIEGMFTSADQNAAWEEMVPVPTFLDVGLNALRFTGSTLWASTNGKGLWRYDESAGWRRPGGAISTSEEVVGLVPWTDANAEEVFVAATHTRGVYISTDGGNNFHTYEGRDFSQDMISAIAVTVPAFVRDQLLAIAVSRPPDPEGKIEILEDDTWYGVTLEQPGKVICLEWAEDASAVPCLYVGTDSGVTFVRDPVDTANVVWADMKLRGMKVLDLQYSDGKVFAATYAGVFSSGVGDEGEWVESSEGLASPAVFDLAKGPTSASPLMAATSDGLYEFNGGMWTKDPGLFAQSFTDMDVFEGEPEKAIVSSFGSGVFTVENGDWYQRSVEVFPFAFDVAYGGQDNSIIYAAGVQGMAVSEDGGNSWTIEVFGTGTNSAPVTLVAAAPGGKKVWFVVAEMQDGQASHTLYYSEDKLWSFVAIMELGRTPVYDLVYSPANDKLYVLTEDGIWRFDDPDVVGPGVSLGLPGGTLMKQLAVAEYNLFALSQDGHGRIYLSTDNGETWDMCSPLPGSMGEEPSQGIATDPMHPDFIMAADNGLEGFMMYASADRGQTWTLIDEDVGPAGAVPGKFKCCAVQVTGETSDGLTAYGYAASTYGIFFNSDIQVGSGGSEPDTLDLTITAVSPSFRPEIGELAEFVLGGNDIDNLENWRIDVETSDGTPVTSKSGVGRPPDVFQWDGYTDEGWMYGEDTYTVTFQGGNTNGSADAEAQVELIIGRPPRSIFTDATKGGRLLLEYNADFDFMANILYRSREPAELFGVGYKPETGTYFDGYSVSDSRDERTLLASTALANDFTAWAVWVDEDPELELPYVVYAMRDDDYESQAMTAVPEPVSQVAIAVSPTDECLVAVVTHYSSGDVADIWCYDETQGLWGTCHPAFNEDTPGEITDLELVPTATGVSVLYVADGTLHHAVWTAPDEELDTLQDPVISGVKEFSAASMGEGVLHLVYIGDDNELHYRQLSAGGWSEDESVPTDGAGPQIKLNLTSNVNKDGTFTVAWEGGEIVYYIQRINGEWNDWQTQTDAATDAYYPQLAPRTYSTDQPLIAWTQKEAMDYRVQIAQLGEAPPQDTFYLDLSCPDTISPGDTLEVVLSVFPSAYEMRVWIDEFGEVDTMIFWPDSGTSYDSARAFFYETDWWSQGEYVLRAEAETSDSLLQTKKPLTVLPLRDTSVLLDPARVFFVPNPAIQKSTAWIYYDLSYDAAVTLEIFTARGRRILHYEENDGELVEAGYGKRVEIDISELGSDVYFFRFTAYISPDSESSVYNEEFWALPEETRPDNFVAVTKPFVVVR